MPALHDVQQELREWLLRGVETGVPSWVLAPAGQAAERLDVYRTTVLETLVRALRLSFPTVHRLVGAEFFGAAGQIFAGRHLPMRADLNTYGVDFADYLQS
ncbi:MAG TPA: DNA-binding domain-containing protein, partial [Ramlibacter sp.]